ncbi:MAG TPA: Fe(3+) ABC transporter substrate-binding protein [Hyphomicrobium sp.]|nr:Fe(3+) ABC transporter substrate-binding protein [Hyphomicrobium sp.]HEX2840840.1 Fe(3+) ABC transporter substrate-binding protein [Hyphomicrobium sp.]
MQAFAVAALAGLGAQAQAEETINVYSYREPGLIDPILKQFTAETGIKVNVVYSKDGLIERMVAEGRNSPADLLITPESGLLIQAEAAGVTQALKSKVLEDAIDAKLRDPEGHWFALTRRARVVYASKDRVKQDAITYEELADPKWKGKICIRSGQHTYNIALIASMIAHDGEEKAEKWLIGLRDNLARKPAGGDREGVRDVQAGLCDLAIGNTYYMAAMLKNPEQKPWADAVKMLFPNANERGTHVNISGAALAANAPHRDNAVKMLEFMVSSEAQEIYAEANGEYPVIANAKTSELVKSWGELKADSVPLSEIANLRKKASELVDKVRFDAGPSS